MMYCVVWESVSTEEDRPLKPTGGCGRGVEVAFDLFGEKNNYSLFSYLSGEGGGDVALISI